MIKTVYASISLILCIASPIVYVIVMKKRYELKVRLWDILVGIVATFLGKYVLFSYLCSAIVSVFPSLFSSNLSYSILSIVMTCLMICLSVLLVDLFYYKKKMKFEYGAGFALGATIADLLNSLLMAALSNVIYLLQMNEGTLYENLLQTLSEAQADAVISMYSAYPASYFLYVGIMAVTMLAGNHMMMMLVSAYNIDRKKFYLVFFVITVIITAVVYYYLSPLSLSFANLSLVFIAFLEFTLARNVIRFH
ncbi:MAG: hypothetical protein IJK53_06085 [Erysipelotrichaceae bacterium]|nr:hypothetical protein [Clostridia bacterium]MBQ6216938.1 hypothetical protein [Erysipelotrichaceae bacterium]